MDHLAVKIEINNTAVRTLTAQLQFNLTVEDTTRDKKKKKKKKKKTYLNQTHCVKASNCAVNLL